MSFEAQYNKNIKLTIDKQEKILLIASIWNRSICQIQTFPGDEFLRFYSSAKRGWKILRRMSTSSTERQIRRFHVVVQWTSKKCTKKRDARAELLF